VPEVISDPAEHLSSRLAETTRVITGSLPAQFGFAPAGVVSVTTKSGVYQHGGQLELFAGSDGMIEPAAEWAGSITGANLFGSGSFERERSDIADAQGRSTRDVRHGLEALVFADRLLGADDRISLILGGTRERRTIGRTSISAGTERSDSGYAVGTYQHSASGFTLQASLFAGDAIQEARFAQPTSERRSALGTQIDASYDAGSAHILRAGLLVTRLVVHEVTPGSGGVVARRTSSSVYAQDEWKLAPALTLNLGMRVEWPTGTGSPAEAEPRASLVWSAPGGTTAHVGYARYAGAAPAGEQPPGPPLPNERDDYLDAGIQQRLGAFTFGLDAYRRIATNFLSERQVPGEAVATAFAYGRAELRGIELTATYAEGPFTAWGNLGISSGRGKRIVGGSQFFSPDTLRAAADNWVRLAGDRPMVASAGLTWRLDGVTLSGDVLASSGTVRTTNAADPNGVRAPAFAVLDVAAVYHLRLAGRPTDLRVDLTNLTDARYATSDAANLEGGWTRYGRGRALTIGIEEGF